MRRRRRVPGTGPDALRPPPREGDVDDALFHARREIDDLRERLRFAHEENNRLRFELSVCPVVHAAAEAVLANGNRWARDSVAAYVVDRGTRYGVRKGGGEG